ncbi:MAG TPA: ZIP family metal transporter [Steroidobacteraceae bacterium]|nr:ZIP family metal transporter [Steroidobacteraceae bacterium]
MSTLAWIITFTVLGGVLSVLIAGLVLLLPAHRRTAALPHLVSFATGALLGAALLKLLPHAIESAGLTNVHLVTLSLIGGIFAFFVLEKLVLWRHCHQEDCEPHTPAHAHGGHSHDHSHAAPPSQTPSQQQRDYASAMLILAGDAIHNALDGVMLAAAFLTDVRLGIVAGIAVIAHEIPQEVGDFAILLNGGLSRARALALNLLTSLTSVVGGVVGYFALSHAMGLLPYALAVTAASLLYVAVADLIPGLHRRTDPLAGVQQVALIAIGIAVIVVTDIH